MSGMNIARVAVKACTYAIDKPYDYKIPEELCGKVNIGCRVLVSFGRGNRKSEAVVIGLTDSSTAKGLKPIVQLLDESPILDAEGVRLALWLRDRCFCTFYDVMKAMLPAGIWYRFETVYTVSKCSEHDVAKKLTEHLPDGEQIVDYIFSCKGKITKETVDEALKTKQSAQVIDILENNGILTLQNSVRRGVNDKTERMARLLCSEQELERYMSQKRISAGQRDVLELLKISGCLSVNELKYFTGVSISVFKTLEKNRIIEFCEHEVFRRPKITLGKAKEKISLNHEQNRAYEGLVSDMDRNEPSCALLYGVTGSGKTLVYIKLIEHALARGQSAMMLVPEIALTPQMVERFSSYFGDKIAILHSALAAGERLDEWKRIRNGDVRVVVGTRSAVFAPLDNLGIIILDEEQEHTYKSGNTPRYHARDVAKFRCVSNNALLLLGSATPSVDSMYQAKSGKYKLYLLENRFNERDMPKVIISDMRESLKDGNVGCIGPELREELEKNIAKGEQSILFLNRRGAGRYAICMECGEVPGCPNCSVSLTYHSANGRLMCHHCGYSAHASSTCECGGKIRFVGAGTQKVESELEELFPGVGVMRMDMDTTFQKSAHQDILNKFRDEKIPILLGTQMITKGLDFENVTLVGVLSADQALYIDNYYATEDTFSLITQVVGRAGRGDKEGRAVLQTLSPKNAVIELAAKQDYMGFYEDEIKLREIRNLPPFRDLISITVSGESEDAAVRGCMRILGKISYAMKNAYSDIQAEIFGPAAAAVAKINNRFRFRVQIGGDFDKRMRALISSLIRDFKLDRQNNGLQISVDVNSEEM